MVDTPSDGGGPGGQFYAAELVNLARAANGYGVRKHTYSMTVTGANMVVTIPAFDYTCPDGSGGSIKVTKTSTTDVTIAASDGSDPRTDIIKGNASGSVAKTDGTPTTEAGTTRNSGMATISSGTTSVVITHGLSATPTVDDIFVTLGEDPTNTPGAIWVDTITSTQFTINCENDPGASNLDLGWQALVISSDPLEAPMPALADDEVMLAKVRTDAGVAVIGTDKVFGRAIFVGSAGMGDQPAQLLNTPWFVAAGGSVLDTDGAWTTANGAIFTPLQVTETMTVKKLGIKNGATIGTDNADVGLYDSDAEGLPQTRLTSIGPTALSGTNGWQEFDVADVTIQPGLYYLAAVFNGTTDGLLRLAAITVPQSRDYSMYQQLSAGTLPATATPVIFTATRNVPQLSLNRTTL